MEVWTQSRTLDHFDFAEVEWHNEEYGDAGAVHGIPIIFRFGTMMTPQNQYQEIEYGTVMEVIIEWRASDPFARMG